MTKLKARNRLHASRVDRIAIVDRPAVPDAQILVFKRYKDEEPSGGVKSILEKGIMTTGFNSGFVIKATYAAVDSLQNEVYNAIYSDGQNSKVYIKEAFGDFENIVVGVLFKLAKKIKAKDDTGKLTKEDVVKPFARGLAFTAIDSVFYFFKSNISSIVLAYNFLESPDDTLKEVIKQFQEYVTKSTDEIISNKKEGDKPAFEKAGRTISAARLSKLKEAMTVLTEIVNETETRYTEKSFKEGDEMDLQEVLKQIKSLSEKVDGMISSLKLKGFLLNEEEAGIYNSKILSEKTTKEAELKKADLIKRAKDLGMKEDSSEADIIGAEKKVEIDAEKVKNDAIAAEKKAKDEHDTEFGKMKTDVESVSRFIKAVEKRFGVKSSLEEEGIEKKEKGDVFGDAITGKTKA